MSMDGVRHRLAAQFGNEPRHAGTVVAARAFPTEPRESITDRVRLCLNARTYIENVTKPIPVDLVVVVGS